MVKYNNKTAPSPEVVSEAQAIAKGTQRPGQTKEQTKLIAQGIQKGIEQYKKQHKSKARELDKKLKKASQKSKTEEPIDNTQIVETPANSNLLPWMLLALSWSGFIAYLLLW